MREVYNKREEADQRWVDERREAIARRLALNGFKAQEQQRELQLQVFKQKELHKVRMLEATERKEILDAECQEKAEIADAEKAQLLARSGKAANETNESRRECARLSLDKWHTGVQRADKHRRREEVTRIREAQGNWEHYMLRLSHLGEARHNHLESHGQKNDKLKTRIQCSLVQQLKDQETMKSDALAESIDTKIQLARERRHMGQFGTRYNFVEKAFGAGSAGFDVKDHSIAVDRRQQSWQRSAAEWSKLKPSFSEPSFSSTASP